MPRKVIRLLISCDSLFNVYKQAASHHNPVVVSRSVSFMSVCIFLSALAKPVKDVDRFSDRRHELMSSNDASSSGLD